MGWRIKIPECSWIWADDRANNALEFLGMAVNVCLLLGECQGERYPSLMALGDNTSAIGWMFKSGIAERDSVYSSTVRFIARTTAKEVMEAGAQLVTQHIRGETNEVADLLSFAGEARGKDNPLTRDEPPDDILTQRIHSYLSQLVPEHFRICQLPEEISSFVCAALRILDDSLSRSKKHPGGDRTELGSSGKGLSDLSDSEILSLMTYPASSEKSWPGVSLPTCGIIQQTPRDKLMGSVRGQWWRQLSAMPLAVWQRRFGQVAGRAPSTSRTGHQVWAG